MTLPLAAGGWCCCPNGDNTKKLILLLALSIAIGAQTANPDVLFLPPEQLRVFGETQQRVAYAQKELEAALEAQKNAVLEFRLQLKAYPETHENLAFDGKAWGFKRKAQPKDQGK